nr:hypothetical protein [Tanacetum cinerariifolium]
IIEDVSTAEPVTTAGEDNIQAMMDADRLFSKRLHAKEREEFSEVQKGRSFDEIKKMFDKEMRKKQKVDENFKLVIDDSEELKKYMEIVPDDGEDLEVLWAIVKDRLKKEKPVDDMNNLLFRTLKTMFEHHVEDTIWKYQQGLAKVKNWKLFESCGSDVRLQVDHDAEMAYDLLRFIRKQLMEGYTPQ